MDADDCSVVCVVPRHHHLLVVSLLQVNRRHNQVLILTEELATGQRSCVLLSLCPERVFCAPWGVSQAFDLLAWHCSAAQARMQADVRSLVSEAVRQAEKAGLAHRVQFVFGM